MLPRDDPIERADEELLDVLPESNRQAYDIYDVIRRIVDDGVYFDLKPLGQGRSSPAWPASAGVRPGSSQTSPSISGGSLTTIQPTRRRVSSTSATPTDAARLPGGRARLHGRDQGRGGGDHPPRRQDAARDGQRHRPEGHGDPAQGLRRRLLRDVRAGLRARPDRRLADGGDQRHGRRGRGGDRLPQGGRGGRRPRCQARGADRRLPPGSSTFTSQPATT